MRKLYGLLGGIALFLTAGFLINQIPGVDDEEPKPAPTRGVGPDYEPPQQDCASWYYC